MYKYIWLSNILIIFLCIFYATWNIKKMTINVCNVFHDGGTYVTAMIVASILLVCRDVSPWGDFSEGVSELEFYIIQFCHHFLYLFIAIGWLSDNPMILFASMVGMTCTFVMRKKYCDYCIITMNQNLRCGKFMGHRMKTAFKVLEPHFNSLMYLFFTICLIKFLYYYQSSSWRFADITEKRFWWIWVLLVVSIVLVMSATSIHPKIDEENCHDNKEWWTRLQNDSLLTLS